MDIRPRKIRYIAIDDSFLDLHSIAEYAKHYDFFENCGAFSNAMEGFEAQQYIKPDLVFLDIKMQGINGIELLRTVRKSIPMAVFITSHPEFAIDGFELSALDYVLKPLTEQRFEQTARRIREYWDMRQKAETYEVLFEKDTLMIKEGYSHVRVAQREIIYLEAMQDYTKIVTSEKNYLTLSSLSFFMEQLPVDRFVRIHRSYAVSLNHIVELRGAEVVCDLCTLPIGKTYRNTVAQIKF